MRVSGLILGVAGRLQVVCFAPLVTVGEEYRDLGQGQGNSHELDPGSRLTL